MTDKRGGRKWHATLTVVGLQFRWKAETRRMMPDWCPFPVRLEREPDNRYDEHAIKVVIDGSRKLKKLDGTQLGYISNREVEGQRVGLASILAPALDAGTTEPVKLWVTDIDPEDCTAVLDATFRDLKKPASKRKTK